MSVRLFVPSDDGYTGNTVAGIIQQYLSAKTAQAAAGLLSPRSVVQTEKYLSAFGAEFGHLDVSECRRGDLTAWLSAHPEWKSPHTKAIAVAQVVACFRWAVDAGLIAVCPYARPDLPACEPRAPMTEHELRLILQSARLGYKKTATAFRLALWFLWQTGCRTCEMRELRWEHYDDERGTFELPSKTTRKTGRKRLIVLGKRAWRLIRWLRRCQLGAASKGCSPDQPPGYVFTNSQGKQWDKDLFARRFRRYARLAGVREEVSAYSARHGFCVARLQAGKGQRQIADLMGHTSTRYVEWYGRGTRRNVDYLRDTLE